MKIKKFFRSTLKAVMVLIAIIPFIIGFILKTITLSIVTGYRSGVDTLRRNSPNAR